MKLIVSIFSGVAVAVGLAVILGGYGGLTIFKAYGCLLVGLVVALVTFVHTREAVCGWDGKPLGKISFWAQGILLLWGLASLRSFFWLIYPVGDEYHILSPFNLGDLSLHIGFIRYLASGIDFWPTSPILVGESLTYPAGADIFNSLLLLVGLDWRVGLVAVGVVWSVAAGGALYRYGGAFAVAAVLLGGGLAGFQFFASREFILYGCGELDTWKNVFLTMLVTQRGFLYALPTGLVLLWAWQKEFFDGERRLPLAVQVLLYGTMPLFQMHTFLILSLALVVLFALVRDWKPVRLVLLTLVPASISVLLVTNSLRMGGFARFEPSWAFVSFLHFVAEFGPAFVVTGIALFFVGRWRKTEEIWLAATALIIAIIGFLFPLTEWAWDNTKLLVWAWIIPAPLIAKYVIAPLPLAGRMSVCVVLFFTGFLSLLAGLDTRHGYTIALRQTLAACETLVKDLPPETVIACQPNYNSPFILLGRRVVCGYEGHLASHGLDYRKKLNNLRIVLDRSLGWQAAAYELGADFIAIEDTQPPRLVPVLPAQ